MGIVHAGAGGGGSSRVTTTLGITGYQSFARQADADGAGRAEVVLAPVGVGGLMLVQFLLVQTATAGSAVAKVYIGEEAPHNMVDGTPSGSLDRAEYVTPLIVPEGEQLRVVWTGATAGDRCTARFQIAEAVIQRAGS